MRLHGLAAAAHRGAAAQRYLQQVEAAQMARLDAHGSAVLHVVQAGIVVQGHAVVAGVELFARVQGGQLVRAEHAAHELACLVQVMAVEQAVAFQR